jgi:hypothetical protein
MTAVMTAVDLLTADLRLPATPDDPEVWGL